MSTFSKELSSPLPAAAAAALNNGNKIDAIKIVREQTGLGLAVAKALIERWLADPSSLQRHDTPAGTTSDEFPVAAKSSAAQG